MTPAALAKVKAEWYARGQRDGEQRVREELIALLKLDERYARKDSA